MENSKLTERILYFLAAAFICAVVSLVVVLQERLATLGETMGMGLVGVIAGMLAVVIFVWGTGRTFDKWNMLSAFAGTVVIYIAMALGAWFGILTAL